ncbi:HAD hydrolase-like protein [Micromonospora sp. DR5-3]|uniref:HAD family hydrolase n=1 Tax=unclassified Micromonospora TaxID=2617518 RepID=UPI0011D69046|nr:MULTISPECIES: HAD family hydrolase [unclassified Micromonospora]MCW3816744.1 HAD hydrolase-like protein [Micromonospora sp. DR5-3]TYC20679.1 HAD family hydrolase [Micromonospora sp. MP36]
MIRAVAVDVDDTLCLTEAACFELENEVLGRIGRDPMPRAVHLATWGQPLLDAMRLRSPGVDLDRFAAAYPDVLHRYVAAGRLDVIPPENLRALDRLVAAGRTVLLLTSRTEAEMAHLLAPEHVLAERVSAVFHAGNTRYRKPDPRAFDELLARTGFAPHECAYVGDSPGDAEAAGKAGLSFVGCLQSGVRRREDFDPRHVDLFIDAFPEVVDAVARLESGRR